MGKILIACEESQVVTKEMRALGIVIFSTYPKKREPGRGQKHFLE